MEGLVPCKPLWFPVSSQEERTVLFPCNGRPSASGSASLGEKAENKQNNAAKRKESLFISKGSKIQFYCAKVVLFSIFPILCRSLSALKCPFCKLHMAKYLVIWKKFTIFARENEMRSCDRPLKHDLLHPKRR